MAEPEILSPKQFEAFRDFIYGRSGIRMDSSKITLVSSRIRRRLRAGEFPDFGSYYRHLTSAKGNEEVEQFLDAITTNETYFFRTPSHFAWFKTQFLTDLLARERQGERERSVRLWSAACSTGEEPFSLAICLAENSLRLRDWKIAIVGTDISEAVLRDARNGVYKPRVMDEVTAVQRRRYFEAAPGEDETWQVRTPIREMVEFRRHNLLEPLRLPPFDCIFVRNVLIYFDRESKKIVVKHLIQSLARGGYLVVGPSEGIYDMLDPLVKCSTFAYRKT